MPLGAGRWGHVFVSAHTGSPGSARTPHILNQALLQLDAAAPRRPALGPDAAKAAILSAELENPLQSVDLRFLARALAWRVLVFAAGPTQLICTQATAANGAVPGRAGNCVFHPIQLAKLAPLLRPHCHHSDRWC